MSDKHRITLSNREIGILIDALDSADFYCEGNCDEFFRDLERLKKRLGRFLSLEWEEKKLRNLKRAFDWLEKWEVQGDE